MGFKSKKDLPKEKIFESPKALYESRTLAKQNSPAENMWVNQGEVVREYTETSLGRKDVAIEMPTGSGKTLPALIIAEWTRRKREGPVLYVTPTKQLAQQVSTAANKEGIPVELLVGSWREWDASSEMAVNNGKSIGITTYSSIFNSSPKLPVPALIIFDDAHAGEQFVGNEYSISISRSRDSGSYSKILKSFRNYLPKSLISRLNGPGDPGAHHQMRMFMLASSHDGLKEVDAALGGLGEPYCYQLSMIREGIASCCVFVSHSQIQIRPMVPPTFNNKVFEQAGQRLYLSATLGRSGELERSFGVSEIHRIPNGDNAHPPYGRRFLVFPEVAETDDPMELVRKIIALKDKAIILSQSTVDTAENIAEKLAGPDVEIFGRDTLEKHGIEYFGDKESGILGLANRYDGIDLPKDQCRILVMNGKPDAISAQEKWISERARANELVRERFRTRIVQGIGRCTRGPDDYAVVIILGRALTNYLGTLSNISMMDPDFQAEVEFGLANSEGETAEDILHNVSSFLAQNDEWTNEGRTEFDKISTDIVQQASDTASALQRASSSEVIAWGKAFGEDWAGASKVLQDAFESVGSPALRDYRAILHYLSGFWLQMGAEDQASSSKANQLIHTAKLLVGRNTWVNDMPAIDGGEELAVDPIDGIGVRAIVAILLSNRSNSKISESISTMISNLECKEATAYERGLVEFGNLIGAEAFKPKGQANCDAAWLFGDETWVAVEAKSEQDEGKRLSHETVRQVNSQLSSLAYDQDMNIAPEGSVSVIVTDRIAPDPQVAVIANPNLFMVSTEEVLSVGYDLEFAWKDLISVRDRNIKENMYRDRVLGVLRAHGCLPSMVIDRLTGAKIEPIDVDFSPNP